MATPSASLISALRTTANRLAEGAPYRWTHQGHCNCGHVVQTLTHLPPEEIHRRSLEKPGDWAEKARDYCPGSGYSIDFLMETLLQAGLTPDDISHLERLSDHRVYPFLPFPGKHLNYRQRDHVVAYLYAWALLLEAQLTARLQAPVLASA